MEKPPAPRDTGKQKVRSAEVGTDILKALAELSPATSLSRLAEHVQMPATCAASSPKPRRRPTAATRRSVSRKKWPCRN